MNDILVAGTSNHSPCEYWDSEERRCKKAFEKCNVKVDQCGGMVGYCCIKVALPEEVKP
jgi:hypothetical protein